MWKLVNIVEEIESSNNGKIKVIKSIEGTRILVGGISQSGWLVKKVWKDALKKIKKVKSEAGSILILGLGGGSVVELVDDYWPESNKTGVDIDSVMIEMGKKYLNLGKVKNLRVVVSDAEKFTDECREKFDLILVDIYKGANIPKQFTTKKFMAIVCHLLKKDGVAAFNHLYSSIEKKDADEFGRKLRSVFPASTSVAPEANIIFICFS